MNRESVLGRWGRFVYRHRWPVIVTSMIPVLGSIGLVARGGGLEAPTIPGTIESGAAVELMERQLPGRPVSFSLIFSSPTLSVTEPRFRASVERAVAPLRRDPSVAAIHTAYDGGRVASDVISRDGHRTLVVVELRARSAAFASLEFAPSGADVYSRLRPLVRSDSLEVLPAGPLALNHDFHAIVREDLRAAELVVLPLVLLLLLVVFGSPVAAALPIAVGLCTVVTGMAGTFVLSQLMPVSAYAINIVTMIGLGVAVDYSLFLVSRFREELARATPEEALPRAAAAAGRVVIFSGMTVAIGLLALLVLPISGISSMGVAGTIVVACAVLYGLTFLVALLGLLGERVNAFRIPFLGVERRRTRSGFWHRLATLVMRHPWSVLVPLTALLVLLATPALHLKLASGGARSLPVTAESRRGEEILQREFPGRALTPIVVVLDYRNGSPLTSAHVGGLHDLSQHIHGLPDVARVDSVVDVDPRMTRAQYQAMAEEPPSRLPPSLRILHAQTVGAHIAILVAQTERPPESREARGLVTAIRRLPHPADASLLVTGPTAFDVDFIDVLERWAPAVVGAVLLATYVALFVLLGSVLLPLKAVVMNLLSITASYGALVWLFQDGHLAHWLGFTPGPIEPAIPLIMFCLLFGLSMDYEVLLLSRTREEHRRTGDDTQAVADSLEHTGRLITGAAAMMAAVFFGFGLSRTVIVTAMGIGMGLAVVVDATVIRALLVPATMALLGRWNWWAPPCLRRLHGVVGVGDMP
jgi:putative drug exporter of the RND superfamily